MPIDPIGGGMTPYDSQTLGASVVTNTLNMMNSQGPSMMSPMAPMDKQTIGASVVTGTLNTMNYGSPSGMAGADPVAQSFDFNQQVLGAYAGTGSVLNTMV